jgi:hypothetical protein
VAELKVMRGCVRSKSREKKKIRRERVRWNEGESLRGGFFRRDWKHTQDRYFKCWGHRRDRGWWESSVPKQFSPGINLSFFTSASIYQGLMGASDISTGPCHHPIQMWHISTGASTNGPSWEAHREPPFPPISTGGKNTRY